MYKNAAKDELVALEKEITATATDFDYDVTETIQLVPAQ